MVIVTSHSPEVKNKTDMTLHELFANHPWIAGCLVAFVAAELIVAGVLVARLFRKPKSRRDAGH